MDKCQRDELAKREQDFAADSSVPGSSLFDLIPASLVWLLFGVAIALDYQIPDNRQIAIPAIPSEPSVHAKPFRTGEPAEDKPRSEIRLEDSTKP